MDKILKFLEEQTGGTCYRHDMNEFKHLLYMPETYIVYRKYFEHEFKLTDIWRRQFDDLMNSPDAEFVKELIISNDYKNYHSKTDNLKILNLMKHYAIKRDDLKNIDLEYKDLKLKFDKLIKRNQHHNLTLTYDFEATTARRKHRALA